jgi:hypothetical protein
MSFEIKYLKYKMKYLTLKNQIAGECKPTGQTSMGQCYTTGNTLPQNCRWDGKKCKDISAPPEDPDSDDDNYKGPSGLRPRPKK